VEKKQIILFTGGGGAGSEGLFKILNKKYIVHFADAEKNSKPAFIPEDNWHNIEGAKSKIFLKRLLSLCKKLKISILVPTVDEELEIIALNKKRFDCKILLPDIEFIKNHLDKYKSYLLLSKNKVSVAKTYALSNYIKLKYPLIIKPRFGRGSRHVAKIKNKKQLNSYLNLFEYNYKDVIAQEYLDGDEYTVMVLANKNDLISVVPVKVTSKKGITIRGYTTNNRKIINLCKQFHKKFKVFGYYNIQLIKKNNDYKIIEINPRISTTACLCLAAGIDFLKIFSIKESVKDLTKYKKNLHMKRSWINEFYLK